MEISSVTEILLFGFYYCKTEVSENVKLDDQSQYFSTDRLLPILG